MSRAANEIFQRNPLFARSAIGLIPVSHAAMEDNRLEHSRAKLSLRALDAISHGVLPLVAVSVVRVEFIGQSSLAR
jgi:hypothetical protein